tara:strand:- start:1078 stop:1884 length:807 start_codon:yes stop_codon:yes gene_type:complete
MSSHSLFNSFENAKKQNRTALLTYTVAGDPNTKSSLEIFRSIAKSGADIIEVGIGHEANIGDGKAIQDSTYRALSNGIKTNGAFDIIKTFRSEFDKDVIIMTYQNKIMAYGEDNFIKKCNESRVSGIIAVDWPWPINLNFSKKCKENNIVFIQLLSPTTNDSRLKSILSDAHEVVYYISMLSTTGGKLKVSSKEIINRFNKIKKISPDKKVIIGFGITQENIKDFKKTDGCVVGSALCKEITTSVENGHDPATKIGEMVSNLSKELLK